MFLLWALCALLLPILVLPKSSSKHTLTSWDSACDFGYLTVVGLFDTEVSEDNCDSLYNKKIWRKEPDIYYSRARKNRTYTLLMLDPDVPGYPLGTFYLHFLAANLKGSDLMRGDFSKADILSRYVEPSPKDANPHRFMFVVFRHVDKTARIKGDITKKERKKFTLADWIESIGVDLYGPRAGVQFRAH